MPLITKILDALTALTALTTCKVVGTMSPPLSPLLCTLLHPNKTIWSCQKMKTTFAILMQLIIGSMS
ncbi:unnamed protein product, partial [Rhizoctonia solani]